MLQLNFRGLVESGAKCRSLDFGWECRTSRIFALNVTAKGAMIPSSSTELEGGIVLTGGIFLVYSTVGQVRPVNSNQPAGIYVSACSIGVGEICTSPVARQLRRH